MSSPSPEARTIAWPSVITVVSAAILIGAEVFGGAFAAGWALGVLLGLDAMGVYALQGIFFAGGVFVMIAFLRKAQLAEPFFRRA